jgi:integrase
MSLATNIVRRQGSSCYYARLRVPKDLQDVAGKSDRWQSLRTSDSREAKLKASAIVARWQAEFDDLRRRRIMTEADLAGGAWDHYVSEIDLDAKRRASLPSTADIEAERARAVSAIEAMPSEARTSLSMLDAAIGYQVARSAADYDRDAQKIQANALRKHLAIGETALIEWAADNFITRERLLIQKGSLEYKGLCQSLQRAQLQALERGVERDQGNWAGTPSDPLVAPPQPGSSPKLAAPGETIMELFARFKREKFASVKSDTWEQNQRTVAIFAEFVGPSAHISVITRKAVRDWKQHLLKYPVRATDSKSFKRMSFREAVAANAASDKPKPTLSNKTINRYLSALGKFCGWLAQNEYLDSDVVGGQLLEIDKTNKKVRPYAARQLAAILSSPLFVGCAGDAREHVAGKVKIRDWRYWLPTIAIYSGARLGEIAQLLIADIREDRGVWIFHITPEGSDDKTVKTEGSARVVPVHPRLIELGLLDYREKIKERGDTRLFPTATRDTRGHFGAASRFFGKYFERIGVKGDRSANFHSFRHGVADAFRRAGYLDEQFGLLLGHTGGTTTGRYGMLPQGELLQRKAMIDAIIYDVT